MSNTSKASISTLTIVALWLFYQLWLPTLSFAYIDGFLFISLCIVAVVCNITMWLSSIKEDSSFWWAPVTVAVILAIVFLA